VIGDCEGKSTSASTIISSSDVFATAVASWTHASEVGADETLGE
jgi:hypothetical protein